MRAVLVAVALLSCIVVSAFGAGRSPTIPQKPRVAVLEFDVQDGPGNLAGVARDEVSSSLVNSGRFEAYNRARLATVLQEHRLGLTGIVDPATAVKIGKFTGVQIVVCGSVQSASSEGSSYTDRKGRTSYSTIAKVSLHCIAIDANDGSIWKEGSFEGSETASGSVDASPLFVKAISEAAGKFAKQLVPPIAGVVVKVVPETEGGYFIITLGADQGVTSKSEFKVERKGEEIRGPDGRVIGIDWQLISLAHPIQDGIQQHMAKLAPGHYSKDILGQHWKEERRRVSEVRVGDRVTAVPRKDDK